VRKGGDVGKGGCDAREGSSQYLSGEELEQGLRLMNLIDHKERRRA
jgi:hypothetical protein